MPLLSDACLILFWDTVTYLEVIPTYLPMPLLRCFLNPILRYCDLHWGHTDLPTPALRPLQSWEGGTKSSFFVAGFDGLDSKLCMQMRCGALGRRSTRLFHEQTVPVAHFRQKVVWTLHLDIYDCCWILHICTSFDDLDPSSSSLHIWAY